MVAFLQPVVAKNPETRDASCFTQAVYVNTNGRLETCPMDGIREPLPALGV